MFCSASVPNMASVPTNTAYVPTILVGFSAHRRASVPTVWPQCPPFGLTVPKGPQCPPQGLNAHHRAIMPTLNSINSRPPSAAHELSPQPPTREASTIAPNCVLMRPAEYIKSRVEGAPKATRAGWLTPFAPRRGPRTERPTGGKKTVRHMISCFDAPCDGHRTGRRLTEWKETERSSGPTP